MRDRRHNEKSGGHQICSPGIVQLAEGWETGAKMGNRGLGIGKQSKQDKVNTADSAFIFLIIQSQNQWSSSG